MPSTNSKRKFSETLDSESSNPKTFLSAYHKKPAISQSRLIKHVLKKFNEENFSELESDLKNYGLTENELRELFLSSWLGKGLLSTAIVLNSNHQALAFFNKNCTQLSVRATQANSI